MKQFLTAFWIKLLVVPIGIFILNEPPLKAQPETIGWSSSSIDFGRIAAIVYPAKVIEFTNKSSNKMAILLIDKGPNVKANFQRKFYQPGEKGFISVYYDARMLGEFNETMKIYTNLDTAAHSVTLKGVCISIQECFPNINNLNLRNVMVINKWTFRLRCTCLFNESEEGNG